MPRFDGTGPMGQGPMTGKGFGPCGMGSNWKKRISKYSGLNCLKTKEEQKKALSNYKEALEKELEEVKKEERELDKEE